MRHAQVPHAVHVVAIDHDALRHRQPLIVKCAGKAIGLLVERWLRSLSQRAGPGCRRCGLFRVQGRAHATHAGCRAGTLAGDGITVNAVHPDAVFDTNLWTQEALETSASRYGMSVEAYKQRNLLKAEIRSTHVASAILAFVDGTLPRTTGAQLPVDGGNDRVI